MSVRSQFAALFVMTMSSLSGIPAHAGVPVASPDSAALAAMRREFGEGLRVRVRTASDVVMLNRAQVSAEGVSGLYGVTREASITAAREEPRLVPWSEIERVERVSSGMGRGIVWGMGIGLVMGVVTAARIPPDKPRLVDDGIAMAPPAPVARAMAVIFTPVGCGLLGAIVGTAFPRWKRVHPAVRRYAPPAHVMAHVQSAPILSVPERIEVRSDSH